MANVESAFLVPELEQEWNDYIEKHPLATIYHTLEWKRILESTLNYKPLHLLVKVDKKIVGICPIFQIPGFFLNKYIAVPFRDRGGPIADNNQIQCEILKLIPKLLPKKPHLIELKCLEEVIGYPKIYSEFSYWYLCQLDIDKNCKDIFKTIASSANRNFKTAKKQGLYYQIKPTNNGLEDFYTIYYKRQKMLGTPSFSKDYFNQIGQILHAENKSKILIAYKDDIPIAATLLLFHKNTIYYAYSASHIEYWPYKPNDFLIGSIVEAYAGKYKLLDLGADSPLQKTLIEFKTRWSSKQKKLPFYIYEQKFKYVIPDSALRKFSLARQILKKMPDPIYKIICKKIIPLLG